MGWMSSKQSSSSSLDPVQREAIQTGLNYARSAADQPFRQYQGPWTAGINSDLDRSWDAIGAGQYVGMPALQAAQGGASSAMQYQPGQVGAGSTTAGQVTADQVGANTGAQFMGQYFNPFLSQVAGGMVSDMDRARTAQRLSDEDRAIAAGAYGGSRHGVMDAMATRDFNDVLSRNVGDLYARGFDSAAGLGQQDASRFGQVAISNADRNLAAATGNADRAFASDTGNVNRALSADQFNVNSGLQGAQQRLAGSSALAGMAGQDRQGYMDWARALNQAGTQQFGIDQAQADSERARFNEWRDYPQLQSQIINQAVQGMPNMGGTQTQKSGGSTMDGIGSLASLAGMVMMFASDEDTKSDVSLLGSEEDVLRGIKKTPVKTWRYDPRKGGPNDGGKKHIGPMAQDIKRNLGIGTGRAMPVVDVLGAHHAAISALAKKVDRKGVSDVKIKRKGK